MGPRNSSSNSRGEEKGRVVRTAIKLKKEIIAMFENGVRVSDLATPYMERSAISTFLKNKEAINLADLAKEVSIVHSKQTPQIMDEVE